MIWDVLVLISTLLVTSLICRCGRSRSHENSITTRLKYCLKILPKNIKILVDDTSAYLRVAEKKLSEDFIIMITYHSTWTATRSRQRFWILLSTWWRHDKKLFSKGIGIVCKARNILILIREKFCTRDAFLFLGWHYCMWQEETHSIYTLIP